MAQHERDESSVPTLRPAKLDIPREAFRSDRPRPPAGAETSAGPPTARIDAVSQEQADEWAKALDRCSVPPSVPPGQFPNALRAAPVPAEARAPRFGDDPVSHVRELPELLEEVDEVEDADEVDEVEDADEMARATVFDMNAIQVGLEGDVDAGWDDL